MIPTSTATPVYAFCMGLTPPGPRFVFHYGRGQHVEHLDGHRRYVQRTLCGRVVWRGWALDVDVRAGTLPQTGAIDYGTRLRFDQALRLGRPCTVCQRSEPPDA